MSPRFSFGVECEVAFLWGDGTFADFSNTTPDPDAHLLDRLDAMLAQRETTARGQIAAYCQTDSVTAALGLLCYA